MGWRALKVPDTSNVSLAFWPFLFGWVDLITQLTTVWVNVGGCACLRTVPVVFTTTLTVWAHKNNRVEGYPQRLRVFVLPLVSYRILDKKTINKVSNKPKNGSKKLPKNRNKLKVLQPRVAQTAKMISDPCNASLEPGSYGTSEGYIARFKHVVKPSEAISNGYLLFNPYSNAKFGGYYFTNVGSGASPVNSVAFPLGTGPATSTGVTVIQAGDNFINTAVCQSARTIAACVRMMYIGTTSGTTGRIAYLENIDPSILLNLPSTDEMFSFATKVERTSLDPMEVTYRPAEDYDDRFKPENVGTLELGTAGVSATSLTVEGRELSPKWIGFAWQGVNSDQFVFESYRILEWKPELGQGISNDVPVTHGNGEPVVDKALAALDTHMPGWSTTLTNFAVSGASMLAQSALAGVGLPTLPTNVLGRQTPLRIML